MKSVFSQYAIMDEVTHSFERSPDHYWKIKPITSGEELEYSKFLLHRRIVRDRLGETAELPPTWVESAHREIALSFAGTNIPLDDDKPVEDGGKPLLERNASVDQIEAVLNTMPQDMVYELWTAIGRAYPRWGPALPNLVEMGETMSPETNSKSKPES